MFYRTANYLDFRFLRKDENPIDVAKYDIARLDSDCVDLQCRSEVDYSSTSALILRVTAVAENGEVHVEAGGSPEYAFWGYTMDYNRCQVVCQYPGALTTGFPQTSPTTQGIPVHEAIPQSTRSAAHEVDPESLNGFLPVLRNRVDPKFHCVRIQALQVDAGKVTGTIRDLQGLNGQAIPVLKGLPNLVRQYKDLRTSLVRTHDMMGPADIDATFKLDNIWHVWLIPDDAVREGAVETGNRTIIFPNPDPERPESYNFGPTDEVMRAIQEAGAKVYYRIGRSWGADADPPANFDKFANIVKHVAMHYNQGWAKGFHYDIKY